MPPDALICSVLTDDWCHYWPEYFTPMTTLSCTSTEVGPTTYQPIDPCTARLWTHPHLLHNPSPTSGMLAMYRAVLIHLAPSDTHVFIAHHLHHESHFRLYFIWHTGKLLSQGCAKGNDQTQALCQAVKVTLLVTFTLHPGHIFLWLWPSLLIKTLLTLKPHRYTDVTYDTRLLIMAYLTNSTTHTLTIHAYLRTWPETPTPEEHGSPSLKPLLVEELSHTPCVMATVGLLNLAHISAD